MHIIFVHNEQQVVLLQKEKGYLELVSRAAGEVKTLPKIKFFIKCFLNT